jgi:fatty acid desaturase
MAPRKTDGGLGAIAARVDVSTLAVAMLIYGGWVAATLMAARLPPLVVAPLGGWLIAWHGSLQHETIHGHPTRWRRINRLLGAPPLNLWLPYGRYADLHLTHHSTDQLTVPGADPESRYLRGRSSPLRRAVARANATLAGRMLLGPALEIGCFLAAEAKALATNQPGVRRAWAVHLAGVAVLGAWVFGWLRLSLADYLTAFVYPGAALSLLRSFAEHRADPEPARRIAIVERAPLLGLLFLNNNLHAVHHAFPGASWRRLPGLYAAHRRDLLQANGGLVYRGYADVFRRYLWRPHDVLVHPQDAAPSPGLESVSA